MQWERESESAVKKVKRDYIFNNWVFANVAENVFLFFSSLHSTCSLQASNDGRVDASSIRVWNFHIIRSLQHEWKNLLEKNQCTRPHSIHVDFKFYMLYAFFSSRISHYTERASECKWNCGKICFAIGLFILTCVVCAENLKFSFFRMGSETFFAGDSRRLSGDI